MAESPAFTLCGERGRNRTFNLVIKSHLLCQLSYAPASVGNDRELRPLARPLSDYNIRGREIQRCDRVDSARPCAMPTPVHGMRPGGRRKRPMPLKYRGFSYVIDSKNLGTNAETAAQTSRATAVAQAFGLPRRNSSRRFALETCSSGLRPLFKWPCAEASAPPSATSRPSVPVRPSPVSSKR